MTCSNQIKNLQNQRHEFTFMKRYMYHTIKSEEHQNAVLEHKKLILKYNRLKLDHRLYHLEEQLENIVKKNQTNQYRIITHKIHLKFEQEKITKVQMALKKIIHLNNNFEKVLKENRFLQINEQEKLYSIKQISFQKRKQIITDRKRLHLLAINEHNLIDKTIRNSIEIVRLNHIFHNINNTEKVEMLHVFKEEIRTKVLFIHFLVFSIDSTREKS